MLRAPVDRSATYDQVSPHNFSAQIGKEHWNNGGETWSYVADK